MEIKYFRTLVVMRKRPLMNWASIYTHTHIFKHVFYGVPSHYRLYIEIYRYITIKKKTVSGIFNLYFIFM